MTHGIIRLVFLRSPDYTKSPIQQIVVFPLVKQNYCFYAFNSLIKTKTLDLPYC